MITTALIKNSQHLFKTWMIYPRCLSDSSQDKTGTNEGSKKMDKDEKDLTDLQMPLCSASEMNNPSAPTMYDCRKYSHNLPCDSVSPHFETLPHIPTGIFRCTFGEMLGRGANKCGYYRNPEYFSFHHMTYYDMHLILRSYRQPSPNTGRKP